MYTHTLVQLEIKMRIILLASVISIAAPKSNVHKETGQTLIKLHLNV